MKNLPNLQLTFIVGAIVIGALLNNKNCVEDTTCDPDPLYGGCPSICESGTTTEWVFKSFGLWVLLNIGSILGIQSLKEKENLKNFLNREGMMFTAGELVDESKIRNQKDSDELNKLLKKWGSRK